MTPTQRIREFCETKLVCTEGEYKENARLQPIIESLLAVIEMQREALEESSILGDFLISIGDNSFMRGSRAEKMQNSMNEVYQKHWKALAKSEEVLKKIGDGK